MQKYVIEYISFNISLILLIVFITSVGIHIYNEDEVSLYLMVVFGIGLLTSIIYFIGSYMNDKKLIPHLKYVPAKFIWTSIELTPFGKYGYIIKADLVYFDDIAGETNLFSNRSFIIYTCYQRIKNIINHQEDPSVWVGFMPDNKQKYIVFMQLSIR